MNILVLEDDVNRCEKFCKDFLAKKYVFTICSNIDDTIEQLKKKHWDVLFLDYYIGQEGERETGLAVAEWLANNQHRINDFPETEFNHLPERVITHTIDIQGAEKVYNLLPNVERIPFTTLFK